MIHLTTSLDTQYSAQAIPMRVFAMSGRIGRLRYLAYSLIQLLLMLFSGILAYVLPQPLSTLLVLAAYAAAVVLAVFFLKRRLNDMNRSGWWALLVLVPLVGAIALIWLAVAPGTKGTNAYGAEPPANSLPVKVFGLLTLLAIPLLLVFALIAPSNL